MRSRISSAGLCQALGLAARYIGRNQFDYLVEAESEEEATDLCGKVALLVRSELGT